MRLIWEHDTYTEFLADIKKLIPAKEEKGSPETAKNSLGDTLRKVSGLYASQEEKLKKAVTAILEVNNPLNRSESDKPRYVRMLKKLYENCREAPQLMTLLYRCFEKNSEHSATDDLAYCKIQAGADTCITKILGTKNPTWELEMLHQQDLKAIDDELSEFDSKGYAITSKLVHVTASMAEHSTRQRSDSRMDLIGEEMPAAQKDSAKFQSMVSKTLSIRFKPKTVNAEEILKSLFEEEQKIISPSFKG